MLPIKRRAFVPKLIILAVVVYLFVNFVPFVRKNLNSNSSSGGDGSGAASESAEESPIFQHWIGSLATSSRKYEPININDNIISSNQLVREPSSSKQNQNFIITKKVFNKYEKEIQVDLLKQKEIPLNGEKGKIAHLIDSNDIAHGEKELQKLAINTALSEHISYNRTIPDARNPACRKKTFNLATLPTATVIIIFFNEPYSVLVRTVHSVINTSPVQLLKEIILVDDGSSNVELKQKLDYYVETRFGKKVKIVRLKNRLGLIRARLAGARLAKADSLIFLDAHCECVVHWLEPLLQRIQEKPTSVLVPIIDVIEAKNFFYSTNGYESFQIGGFTWDGHFDWHDIPEREKARQRRECKDDIEICPTHTPTMAGGLFAISRNYFWDIGSYDEQMDGWGGENLEMSFRVWMCGGTIETIPCSRIGHIFREFHPYSFPNDKDTHGINTVRMAKVWMDEYQELLYMNRPDLRNNPDIGDITHRVVLRDKLKCKTFDWFMKTIYPEKFIPNRNVQNYGRIAAEKNNNYCFDDLQQNIDEPYNLGVYACYSQEIAPSQLMAFTYNNVLRTERSCATIDDRRSAKYIVMIPCNTDDEVDDSWIYTSHKQFKHEKTNLCIDRKNLDKSYLHATVCDMNSKTQKWVFQKKSDSNQRE